MKDYYAILGIAEKATDDEIKKAYRALAMKYHPDRNPGNKEAEDSMKEVNEAYDVLGDPTKRRNYDIARSNPGPALLFNGGFNPGVVITRVNFYSTYNTGYYSPWVNTIVV